MSKYSKEDIIRMVREGDVEFIRMQFTDIFGQLKNVAITVSQIEKAVNGQVMICLLYTSRSSSTSRRRRSLRPSSPGSRARRRAP